jgi:hypothetical protein
MAMDGNKGAEVFFAESVCSQVVLEDDQPGHPRSFWPMSDSLPFRKDRILNGLRRFLLPAKGQEIPTHSLGDGWRKACDQLETEARLLAAGGGKTNFIRSVSTAARLASVLPILLKVSRMRLADSALRVNKTSTV